MTISLIFICIFTGTGIGWLTSYLIFNKINRNLTLKYKNHQILYEKNLIIFEQDLKNESNFRNILEKKLQNEQKITYELHGTLSAAKENLKLLDYYKQQHEQICHELKIQINQNHNQNIKINELNTKFEEYKLSIKEKEKFFINHEHRIKIQFEHLTNQIIEQNRLKINEQNQLVLNQILQPFREQLNNFENQIQNNFLKSEQTKHELTYEIHQLHQLNTQITQETVNLTNALKGNNKTQGNWGEVILTRTLELSGMREGHEFHLQINIQQADGRKAQPDVIVHLPNEKEVIIDSKMSLTAYERYFNSTNKKNQDLALHEHIQSLRTHIKSLNKKDYQSLFGLKTLDYILMFIPIESALTIAIEKEVSLLTDAMNCNIMLVSPTTLLIALRTINNLWRYKHQNYNAIKIAEKASRLYDKLRLFVDDLNKIGLYLNKAETTYNAAKNKFFEGKGNIINQAESFKSLGVQIKQSITTTSNIPNLITSTNNNKPT